MKAKIILVALALSWEPSVIRCKLNAVPIANVVKLPKIKPWLSVTVKLPISP